jgi:16S rRNA G1207 methylase RsmC
MNPPFANGDDIKHITHALKMLNPGGRLVAICANGPRQNDKLRSVVDAMAAFGRSFPRIPSSEPGPESALFSSP